MEAAFNIVLQSKVNFLNYVLIIFSCHAHDLGYRVVHVLQDDVLVLQSKVYVFQSIKVN